ncbi:unnamed protein product [Bursaphelenchus okinawaensis]|uniref:C3H1-type domain-containing protein n=1 Tax=Bursaphelenchus okinawaensis TaxID=465554 RepID=A0A811K624_9BILA|nr:unnamed protein product [Bursaphelenchus okinawaensis]CAG9092953.1 unnamed protein product [Bursaphelenchus okinawaensis]
MSNVEKEEGEIESESEDSDHFSIEEQRIDQFCEEVYRVRDEIMRSKSKNKKNHKKSKSDKRSHEGSSKSSLTAKDNYEVVNMDIESPPMLDADDEEERALREMLLQQVMKKRGKVDRHEAKTSKLASSKSSKESPVKSNSDTGQRFPPPLSPPQMLLPPPPIPPPSLPPPASELIMIDQVSDNSDYEPYSPKPCKAPIISEQEDQEVVLNFVQPVQHNVDFAEEESPRSPEQLSEEDFLSSELDETEDEVFDDELTDFEIDLDEEKEMITTNKKELLKAQKRYKLSLQDYSTAKRNIEKLKEELANQERKLFVYAERCMEMAEKINVLGEKCHISTTDYLSKVHLERAKWKMKVNKVAQDTKTKVKKRVKRIFKGRVIKPKVIPLVNVTPKTVARASRIKELRKRAVSVREEKRKVLKETRTVQKTLRTENETVASTLQQDVITSSTELSLDITEIMPGTSDAKSIESQLLERLIKKTRQRSITKTLRTNKDNNLNNMLVHTQSPSSTLHQAGEEVVEDPSPSVNVDGIDKALRNPLIRMRSYRLYPFFPFQHITHPSISSYVRPDVPLCPFELNGLCKDDQCQWQHDQDMRISEHDIIKEMISFYPQICPSNTSIGTNRDKFIY